MIGDLTTHPSRFGPPTLETNVVTSVNVRNFRPPLWFTLHFKLQVFSADYKLHCNNIIWRTPPY
jgi:hypothetical protein